MSNLTKHQIDKINAYADHIYRQWYNEVPVSINQFLTDPEYLGGINDCGNSTFPYWKDTLEDVAREDTKYIIILTGGIGSGKTYTAIKALCYFVYKFLCLKDPYKFFQKERGGHFTIMFFNLTKTLGESKAFNLFQKWLSCSPWFQRHGVVSKNELTPRIDFPYLNYKLASPQAQGFGFIGDDIIMALMDEVDNPIASEKQKAKIIAAYEAGIARFKNRFVINETEDGTGGESFGRFFLLASKQEKLSFLNTFIIKQKKDPHVYIKDDPVWDILPASRFCGKKFPISLGDVYNPPKIIETNEEINESTRRGFKILYVPVEYKADFIGDKMMSGLRNLAGISVTHLRSSKLFSSEEVILKCYDRNESGWLPPSETKTTIEIGLDDRDIDLAKFIDFNQIITPRNIPRFIHIDIAFTNDALGIAMSHISGWTKENERREDGTFFTVKKPVVRTDFKLRLKARAGDRIPIDKVHKLIIDIKKIFSFRLELVTFDLRLASETSMQILTLAGIKNEYLSLDKNPGLYREFRDLVNEGRWQSRYNEYLQFELSNLEDDIDRNKVDHPKEVADIKFLEDGSSQEVVLEGSKDLGDSVAGSVLTSLTHCVNPPDIEVIRKIMEQVSAPDVQKSIDDKDMWILSQKKRADAPAQEQKKTLSSNEIFKQIMQKASE